MGGERDWRIILYYIMSNIMYDIVTENIMTFVEQKMYYTKMWYVRNHITSGLL